MRLRARTDANHQAVVEAFRSYGFNVHSTAQLGRGFPDLVIADDKANYLIEIKDGNKPLTEDEEEFHSRWRGPLFIVRSEDEAHDLAHLFLEGEDEGIT